MSRCIVGSIVFLLPTLLAAQEAEWIQDFAKAQEKAKAEKKDLLVDFTGSDWCSWCIRLDGEVFSQEAFATAVPKDFVLVKLDYPRDESLVTPEIREQNEQLKERYPVQGFPTILLMDAAGHPYGQTGYQKGGPEPYVQMLADMKKQGQVFQAALQRADAAQGADRAKALDEALGALEQNVAETFHLALMQEVLDLDAEDTLGLKSKWATKVQELAEKKALMAEIEQLQELIGPLMQEGRADEALTKLDEVVKAPKNALQHQIALFFKGMITMDTSGDVKAAIESLEAAKALKPESAIGKRIDTLLPKLKQQMPKED
jgi:thioredoxin-related protein